MHTNTRDSAHCIPSAHCSLLVVTGRISQTIEVLWLTDHFLHNLTYFSLPTVSKPNLLLVVTEFNLTSTRSTESQSPFHFFHNLAHYSLPAAIRRISNFLHNHWAPYSLLSLVLELTGPTISLLALSLVLDPP